MSTAASVRRLDERVGRIRNSRVGQPVPVVRRPGHRHPARRRGHGRRHTRDTSHLHALDPGALRVFAAVRCSSGRSARAEQERTHQEQDRETLHRAILIDPPQRRPAPFSCCALRAGESGAPHPRTVEAAGVRTSRTRARSPGRCRNAPASRRAGTSWCDWLVHGPSRHPQIAMVQPERPMEHSRHASCSPPWCVCTQRTTHCF